MRENETHYFFNRHKFGQWTSKEIINPLGISYNCCEQYMMAEKAKLFGDIKSYERIMNEQDPKIQQELGRKIANFDEEIWKENRERIVYSGNCLKFYEHEDLGRRLMTTYPKILAEASFDKIWGIGLNMEDDKIFDENNWTGQNLLGKSLMSVRTSLIDVLDFNKSI